MQQRYPQAALALESYWKKNPDSYLIPEFRKLYDDDPTHDKFLSSTLMWGIHYVYSYETTYSHLRLEDRIDFVESNILWEYCVDDDTTRHPVIGFFKDNAEELKPLIDKFNFLQKDSPLRALDAIDRYLDIRSAKLASISTDSDPKDFLKIDELIMTISKITAERDKIYNAIHPDKKLIVKGGVELSLLARGVINVSMGSLDPYEKHEARTYKTYKEKPITPNS